MDKYGCIWGRNKRDFRLAWCDPKIVQYLYAQGKNLRKADLSDVENAESWDLDTLRALMGSGALYVVKDPEYESSDSDMGSSDSKFVSEKKSSSHVSVITVVT